MICWLAALFAFSSENEGIRRVQAHLVIDNPTSALEEAEDLVAQYPASIESNKILLEAFAANGLEEQALDCWNRLTMKHPELLYDRHILEEISWGVLRKGALSSQYGVKLASAIGAYLTRDIRAVPILLKMMRDSNAVIRCVAVQMASAFQDPPLKDEIARKKREERVWIVRLEVIKAIGILRMKEQTHSLQALVESDKTTIEERGVAIESLLEMYDAMTVEQFTHLKQSNRAGLRHLAAIAAMHFRLEGAKEGIVELTQDPHPAVRIAALNAFGLFYRTLSSKEMATEVIERAMGDNDPSVAITASWAMMLVDPSMGIPSMRIWLKDSLPENRRVAAAALAATGSKGVALAVETLQSSEDPYVKINVSMGLLAQKEEVAKACDLIYNFLSTEKRMWMIDKKSNPLFEVLAPSQVRHNDQIPNYPEAQDQMTRLHLASLLALAEDPRAVDAIKGFLQRKKWGITGAAAAMLLHEGDEGALETVRDLLNDDDAKIRLQACLVLALFGKDESILLQLQGAYSGADHEQKLHILEALGRIGNAQSYSFLMSVLREPFPILRVAAASALIQSVNR